MRQEVSTRRWTCRRVQLLACTVQPCPVQQERQHLQMSHLAQQLEVRESGAVGSGGSRVAQEGKEARTARLRTETVCTNAQNP